jgi:hypothetical protein
MADTEIQTIDASGVPQQRWYCYDCHLAGPAVADGTTAQTQLEQHLTEHHQA